MPTSKSKRGLGRGFESLIPTDLLDESFDPTASQDQQVSELRHIKIDQIIADPDQPRNQFDAESLDDLASSIAKHGVVQPIIVTAHNGGYRIVAGERRFRASKIAGLDKIPALVRTLTDQHRLEISLIENLQREDLNVLETATAYLKLHEQFNISLREIGKRVGNKSKSSVCNKIRLLKLPNFVREELVKGTIVESQARPLIGLDEEITRKVLPKIINEGWGSNRVEQFVVDLKMSKKPSQGKNTNGPEQQPYEIQLKRMQKKLGVDVRINTNTKGAGKITIRFKNKEEFERLQKIIG